MNSNMNIKRNVLLNPGPATTTDSVKLAQVVPDICPREEEFGQIMKDMRRDLVKIVHGREDDYTAVLFTGSGTLNMDVVLNSILPENKKILVINNGAYSSRAVEICEGYHLPYISLNFKVDEMIDLAKVEEVLKANEDIYLVYTTHNETGTGILNPIREIGELVHKYGRVFAVDTTSTLAMRPINVYEDNVDFVMASAQKGLQSMTGLSFIIGRKSIIEASKDFPTRSYYCNLYLQYSFFEKTGEMHFTPPVQTVYATKQAIKEYFEEGESAKWERHKRVHKALYDGVTRLGFKQVIPYENQAGLVVSCYYPDDDNWDFKKVHDYCYERGFTIYPGKIDTASTFRLCALGAIDVEDIEEFFKVFEGALNELGVKCF